jgi:flagellar basal body-associated protein FliL
MPSGMPGSYGMPAKKKSPVLYIVIGIVVAVLVVCGGGTWAISKALNPGSTPGSGGGSGNSSSGGGQFASQQKIDLSVVYSSVQFNFTSLQQASKFSDDSMSGLSYNSNKNYVRVNFQEKQTAQKSSYFSYRSAFLLILPDKTTASAIQAQEYSGPEGGVVRTNWVDFELSKQIDLSKLSLRLGTSDEAQMTVDLKTGADVSKYKPQQATFNKSFQYAGMSWTLKDATQIYYNNGKQAKNGKVFVLVDLTANNPDSNGTVYLYSGFIRLKSGDTVTAPNYDSNLDDFDIVESGTSNVQGTAVFETPPASSYTLDFTSGKNISPASVDFSVGSGS